MMARVAPRSRASLSVTASACPGPLVLRSQGRAYAENEVFRKAALDPSRRLQLRPCLVPAAAPAAGTLLEQAPRRALLQAPRG
jgi:hypothetical protein